MSEKVRLDVRLTQLGLAESREKAKALIMSGVVFVDNEKCDKAGLNVSQTSLVEVRGGLKYVSRGGLKLEKAMALYQIDLTGKRCMDVGASTGGFTDCMLQNGAQKVYAIDVGYGQLAWSLRTDARVVNLERTNFRYLTAAQVPAPVDFASVDVSFISLTLILPVLKQFLRPDGAAVLLIKPQFEAGKGKVGKKGVVREKAVHVEVLEKMFRFCGETGFCIKGITFSPVKGPQGNIEYLFYVTHSDAKTTYSEADLSSVIEASYAALNEDAAAQTEGGA